MLDNFTFNNMTLKEVFLGIKTKMLFNIIDAGMLNNVVMSVRINEDSDINNIKSNFLERKVLNIDISKDLYDEKNMAVYVYLKSDI